MVEEVDEDDAVPVTSAVDDIPELEADSTACAPTGVTDADSVADVLAAEEDGGDADEADGLAETLGSNTSTPSVLVVG